MTAMTGLAPYRAGSRLLRRPVWAVALVALGLSITFAALTAAAGQMLLNFDSISHLQIARRIVDSTSPGLAQLGGVWLPLPHLLMMPLAWIDGLYYSGWSGTVVSMASYVGATVLLYLIVVDLTGSRAAGVVGAAAFAVNPNVLYMQSTPMTELPLFVGLLGMVYGMQRWIRTERYGYLLVSAGAALLATLTRYEAWVLLAGMFVVLVGAAWTGGFDRSRIEGTAIAYTTLAAAGIGGWLLWNQLIFGSARNFQEGEYAKPSLWVEGGEPAIGDWVVSLQSYSFAVLDNLGIVTVLLAVAGAVMVVVARRVERRLLPALALFGFFPFFVIALYLGQRPLHVTQIHGNLYNVRFGLVMILPVAILVGYLAHLIGERLRSPRSALVVTAGLLAVLVTASALDGRVVTREESVANGESSAQQESLETAAFLRSNVADGRVLAEAFGNGTVIFEGRVDPGTHVYEGSYEQWEPALRDPAAHDIEWIVMRTTPEAPDKVAQQLRGSQALDTYDRVFTNDRYDIYRLVQR